MTHMEPDSELLPLLAKQGGRFQFDEKGQLKEEDSTGGGGVRCPKCRWKPQAHDRWMCHCLHAWNTFDTRGKCPGCGHQWNQTMCLSCFKWSEHEAWYESQDPRP